MTCSCCWPPSQGRQLSGDLWHFSVCHPKRWQNSCKSGKLRAPGTWSHSLLGWSQHRWSRCEDASAPHLHKMLWSDSGGSTITPSPPETLSSNGCEAVNVTVIWAKRRLERERVIVSMSLFALCVCVCVLRMCVCCLVGVTAWAKQVAAKRVLKWSRVITVWQKVVHRQRM